MIFIFDQKGNSKATVKRGNLHQGSNLADEIIVLAPIAQSSVVTMSARLPNGLYIYPALAENGKDPIALENLDTDKVLRDPAGIVYSAFRILVPAPMTQYAGILTVQFTFTMGHNTGKDENGETSFSEGQTVTTTALALTVEPGTPILAPKYDASNFADIQSYLNAALSAQVNAEASAGNAAKSEGNAAESASAAGKSAEEAKQWAIAAENRNLNLRNGEKRGSLVQAPSDAEKAQKEPTRDHQVLLGENPPANTDDLLEVGQVFGVRQDGTVYAKGEPKDPEDLIRRCDAPPLIEPDEKGGATKIYGVHAKSDYFPNGKQTAFPSSPSVIKKGWIPFRSEYGDLLVPIEPHADNAAASKEFVNSSIATNTATFRGTFDLTEGGLNKLPWQENDPDGNYYVKNNDYAFLYQSSPSSGSHRYIRYKWVARSGRKGSFEKEYELNSSGFTAAQWGAINSGITKGEISNLWSGIGEKLDLIPPPERKQMGRIYCVFAKDDIDPNGRQGSLRFSANGVVEGIVPTRNTGGNILVPETPTDSNHAASKGYVDSKMGSGTFATLASKANYPTGFTGNNSSVWWANGELAGLTKENLITDWQEGSGSNLADIAFVKIGKTANIVVDGNVYVASGDENNKIKRLASVNDIEDGTIVAKKAYEAEYANYARKMTDANIGSPTSPVYFKNGVPTKCTGNTVTNIITVATGVASGDTSQGTIKVWFPYSGSATASTLMAFATFVYDGTENKQVSVSTVTAQPGTGGQAGLTFTIAVFNPPAKAFTVNWVVMKRTII